MKLLLDIGNTRIKWATLDHTGLSAMQAVTHQRMVDGAWQTQLCQTLTAPPAAVLVSNVAGAAFADAVQLLVQRQWHCPVQMAVTTATATVQGKQIRNAYPDHTKLGVDRWLALLAGFDPQATTLVVSVGTAMTLDAITAAGQHLGGLIVPGPALMQAALLKHTSDIATHAEQGSVKEHFLADNTLGCITQGSWRACAALIHDTHAQLQRDHTRVTVCMTGGAASALVPLLKVSPVVVPDLVLRGLSLLP